MKKLVLKTILITLSAIIAISVLIFGALLIFKPKKVGEMSEKVGNYSFACWAYERQYNLDKSNSAFDDLNYIYTKYALNMIDDGDYKGATDLVLNSSFNGKSLNYGVLEVVKLILEDKKSKVGENKKQELEKYIEKIDGYLHEGD